MKKLLYVAITLGFGLYCFVLGIAVRNNAERPTILVKREFNQELLWTYIQNYKQDQGLQPYIKDQKLCEATDRRLEQTGKSFYHDAFETTESAKIFSETTFRHLGENLASFGSTSIDAEMPVLTMWKNSESHRKNLDNPIYTHSCLRCDVTHCVQLFAGY